MSQKTAKPQKVTWTCWHCHAPQHTPVPPSGRVTCAKCDLKSDKRWCSYCGKEYDADEFLPEYSSTLSDELCPDCEDNPEAW